MQKSRGFSLIELTIVIVVLGILAVTALPRFLDVTEEAQNASVQGMSGGFSSGVMMARAQWEAQGRGTVNGTNSVLYDGARLYLTTPTRAEQEAGLLSPGYPLDTAASGSPTGNPGSLTAQRCLNLWNGLLQNPPAATANFSNVTSSSEDIKYYVSAQTDGNDSYCRYYLVMSLGKDQGGSYVEPGNRTDAYKSFSYRPASGQVATHIN